MRDSEKHALVAAMASFLLAALAVGRTVPHMPPPSQPRKGTYVLGLRVQDTAATAVGAYTCAKLSGGATLPWLVVMLVVGEVMHLRFGVETDSVRWLRAVWYGW